MPTAIQNSSLTRVHKLTYTPIPDVMDNEERANAYPPLVYPIASGKRITGSQTAMQILQ